MTDTRKSEEPIEDLDVPAGEDDQIKGGIQDGTSNTLMVGEVAAKPSPTLQQHCATGKHLPEVKL
jgi:type VI protein secretion system component Hcp